MPSFSASLDGILLCSSGFILPLSAGSHRLLKVLTFHSIVSPMVDCSGIRELVTQIPYLSSIGYFFRTQVNSYECVMGRFCTKDRATRALAAASRMSIAESREYVSNYFNKTTSRSCSCHKSCVYFDVCCEDVDEAVKAKIPPRLQPLVSQFWKDEDDDRCLPS